MYPCSLSRICLFGSCARHVNSIYLGKHSIKHLQLASQHVRYRNLLSLQSISNFPSHNFHLSFPAFVFCSLPPPSRQNAPGCTVVFETPNPVSARHCHSRCLSPGDVDVMDPPRAPGTAAILATSGASEVPAHANNDAGSRPRRESTSQHSEDSQTAADFIRDQMQLEADAREAMPYVCLQST